MRTRACLAPLLWVAGMLLSSGTDEAQPSPRPGELDSTNIPKYEEPLVIPPVMEPVGTVQGMDYYEIAVRQVSQQVLPSPQFGKTQVWAYGSPDADNFNYPGFTIEAMTHRRIRIKWMNQLVDDPAAAPEDRDYLPHLLPVDPTLHWINPPGPPDTRPMFMETPGLYTGPVGIVTHVHGAHVPAVSDGYPEAWFLPDFSTIGDYVPVGTHYGSVIPTDQGAAVYEYTNDQLPATLWYHDHALGITRLNVYAGLAGFYLLRDGFEASLNLPGPAPQLGDELFDDGTNAPPYFEIPIVIQDRSFTDTSVDQSGSATDGSLFYPASRTFFDGYAGPYIPETTVSPAWNPEFFGNAIVVNGRTWPYLRVEPRKYRFRLLNGCNSRFLVIEFRKGGVDGQRQTFDQIGSDGGFLDAPVELESLLLAPAERADVIIDFAGLGNTEVFVRNLGPDGPFSGPGVPFNPADPSTTGQVMKLIVGPGPVDDPSSLPKHLQRVRRLPVSSAARVRDLVLVERTYEPEGEEPIPVVVELGTAALGAVTWSGVTEATHLGVGITEKPRLGSTEVWQLVNLTGDTHPIHLHLVQFQVVERQNIHAEDYAQAQENHLRNPAVFPVPKVEDFTYGPVIAPDPNEAGWKDTVRANPGQVTRIIQRFTKPGLYVWHCHILEHEDNEMMRPFEVVAGPDPLVCK